MKENNIKRDFFYYSPSSVFLHEDLNLTDIRIFSIVHSFEHQNLTCFASNCWLAEKCHVSERAIQLSIQKLTKMNLIYREMKDSKRTLRIKKVGGEENLTPVDNFEETSEIRALKCSKTEQNDEENPIFDWVKFSSGLGVKFSSGGGEKNFTPSPAIPYYINNINILNNKNNIYTNHLVPARTIDDFLFNSSCKKSEERVHMPGDTIKRPLDGVESIKDIKEPVLTTSEKKPRYEPKNRFKTNPYHWSKKVKEFEVDDYAIRVIDELFIELKSIFAAHKQSWTSEDVINSAKANYLRCFNDRGIHQEDKINIGLDKAREKAKESPFLPTCAEFAQWCIDEDWKNFAKLSVEHAYQEACRNTHPSIKAEWTDIVSYNAYLKTGSDVLKRKPELYSFKVFKQNYDWAVDQLRSNNLKNLREVPFLIESDTSEDRKIDKNKAREHIENIRNILRKAGGGF